MIGTDSYYLRDEISNSDLSSLLDREKLYNLEQIYRFGNLVDAMITEPSRVDHLNRQVDGEQFTEQEWATAYFMYNSFRKDEMCQALLKISEGQRVFTDDNFEIECQGVVFTIPARCKFDLWMIGLNYGADIKSTACENEKQFKNAIDHFDYDRQASYYMDISKSDKFLFIGISKMPPHKIFKVAIKHGDELYNSGKQKYSELAFKYWSLYYNFFEERVLGEGEVESGCASPYFLNQQI